MNASGRRYRQAKQKFNHLAKRQRPNYRMRDAETSRRHLERVIATERRMKQGSKKGKSK